VLFVINVFHGSKYCCAVLETVGQLVPHKNFRDFNLFNVDAKSYNCFDARCVSVADDINSGFDKLVESFSCMFGLLYVFAVSVNGHLAVDSAR
jgi:hypothetical protein